MKTLCFATFSLILAIILSIVIVESGMAQDKKITMDILTIGSKTDASWSQAYAEAYQYLMKKYPDVIFKFYRISDAGVMEHYFSTKLETAIIVSIRSWIPNCLDPAKESFTHMEDISFTYTKITWTWEPDGIASYDSWLVRG